MEGEPAPDHLISKMWNLPHEPVVSDLRIVAMIYLGLLRSWSWPAPSIRNIDEVNTPYEPLFLFIMFWTQRESLSLVDLGSQTFTDLTSCKFWFTCSCFEGQPCQWFWDTVCALHWQRECWEHPILCETCILSLVSFHLQACKIRTWAFATIARIMVFPPHLFISDRRSRFTSNVEHRSYITAVNVQHSPQKEKERLGRYCFTSYNVRWRRAALPIK
jgi:hypothetical protein